MVASTRPLAQSIAQANDPQQWLQALSDRYSQEELKKIADAVQWAQSHYGTLNYSDIGSPLFQHAIASAAIVADLRLDTESVIATLLFGLPDVVNDTHAMMNTIAARYHSEAIPKLIEGARRIRELVSLLFSKPHQHHDDQQVEAFRKMVLAMAEDIRVVLIRLAWRTQTMHALAQSAESVRRRVSQETVNLYAPLANRLGVWQIKWELEDLAFRYLHPEPYKKIAKLLDERRVDREEFIAEVLNKLRHELKVAGIQADLMGRPKHIYSIWRKMQKKKIEFSEIYDVRAVRVLVNTVRDCYTVLGLFHSLWQPIPGEFDDYIAHPKNNDYRSLHTAVIGPNDKALEIQIRTFEMHEHSEYGVAAHWRYKEGGKGDKEYVEKIAWLRQFLDWREGVSGDRLARAFKAELFDSSIYVLTPAGKVVSLPRGSTPIDFAYHLHTDLGHRCRGAKVNGQIVPMSTPLENGQRVEILSAKEGGPSLDWLHRGYVKSHRAEQKIRHWIRQQHRDVAFTTGRGIVEKEVSRWASFNNKFDDLAEKLSHKNIEDVYVAIGHGEIAIKELKNAIVAVAESKISTPINPKDLIRASRVDPHGQGILIEGMDQLMTVLARCCKPVPPDAAVGFITKGRGISIHRTDCQILKRLAAASPERLIQATWGKTTEHAVFAIDMFISADDRPGLLRDLSEVMSREKINVVSANTAAKEGHARLRFTLEIKGTEHLDRLKARLMEVNGVLKVSRA